MKTESLTGCVLTLAVALTNGCAQSGYSSGYGYTQVDGSYGAFVENPPPGVEQYPRYRVPDGYVYAVNGRYYHKHNGRWVIYRSAPSEIRHQRPETPDQRGRAERQR